MHVTGKQLCDAVDEKMISNERADALVEFLQVQLQDVPRLSFIHALYDLDRHITPASHSPSFMSTTRMCSVSQCSRYSKSASLIFPPSCLYFC